MQKISDLLIEILEIKWSKKPLSDDCRGSLLTISADDRDLIIGNITQILVILPQQKTRIIDSLSWMIKDMRWRYNQTKMNVDEGSEGGYSPELQEAIALLEEIQDSKL